MLRRLVTAVVVSAAMAAPALAERPRQIGWDDLVPAAQPLANPFEAIAVEAREDIAAVLRARDDLELGFIAEESDEYQRSIKLARRLEEQGIDIDALVAEVVEIENEIDRRGAAMVGDLDGQVIRMPGYALPLELSETGVREFLLVPYVGACIHTPPPPPNQIVFVQLDTPFEIDDLYAPVWITGRLRIEQASRSLSFVDGTAPVATGYALHGLTVEPYQ